MGQKKEDKYRQTDRQTTVGRKDEDTERRKEEPLPPNQTRWDQGGDWGRGDWRLWRPPRGRMRSSPARYKEWAPRPCPRVPGRGRGLVSQCCSVGGPRPSPRFAV